MNDYVYRTITNHVYCSFDKHKGFKEASLKNIVFSQA